MATHYSSPAAWRTLTDREAWRAIVHRVAKSWTRLKQFSSARTWVGVSQMMLVVKNLPAMQIRSLGQEDPLEEEMAAHSSILAWRIPWTEEPGGLQSLGLQSQSSLK